ncbi:MAG: stage II sporulation protein M [Acidimicrobiales bacterium]|nr:stage II sporulation protein M [Acidimicrobiales bacterium]
MPEPLSQFTAKRQPTWDALGESLRATTTDRRSDVSMVRWQARAYRQVVADLAYARRRFPGDPVTVHLEGLVRTARSHLYRNVTRRTSFAHFVTTGFWQRVAERPKPLLVAAALLLLPGVLVGFWSHENPARAARVAQVSELSAGAGDGQVRDPDSQKVTRFDENAAFSSQIFTNNVQVSFVAFAGGVTGGVLTGFSLLFNSLVLGLVFGLGAEAGNTESIIRLVAPHGVLELSLIVVSGAAGLRLGWALLRPGNRTRVRALGEEGRAAVEMALGAGLLLVPCGLVEGFVTPRGVSLPAALAIGFGLGGAFWATVLWRGRRSPVALRAEMSP